MDVMCPSRTTPSVIRYPFLYWGVPYMELTPGVVIVIAAVAVAASVLVVRWSRRSEAAPPVEVRVTPAPRNTTTADERESEPLVAWLLDRAFEQTGVRVVNDALARDRIAQAAVQAMATLRAGESATISLPFLTADRRGPKHFNVRFRRKPDSTFVVES
jgi:hypothetical protein